MTSIQPRWIALLLVLAINTLPALATAADDLEAKVKAAYLYNLTKFVDWPSLPQDVIHVCVVGNDAVSALLGDLANRQVKDHVLRIERGTTENAASCQVMYISRSEPKWQDILNRMRGANVLTVSDRDDFARQGGVVGFYNDAGKIRLEINPDAARSANLRISSKLLELARSVP